MNILIPHSWLLEHLDTQATPEEIQKYLSLSGPSVERIYTIEDEPVFDIEVTTNRVDCMSVRGIAREAAVILTQAGFPSVLKAASYQSITKDSASELPLPKIFSNDTYCKRISCVVLSGYTGTPSTPLMQKRLRQIGVNVHDSAIDTSNYITHELGHPCHMFDYDKIMALGGQIHVKEAVKGQKFTIIDGTTFTCIGGEIVFENQDGEIIDLPGIKGTKNTAIDGGTKNILFWIESIDPAKVRATSMTHALRTVAATLNEKNVDAQLATDTLAYGVTLLQSHAGMSVASIVFDHFPANSQQQTVHFHTSDVERYLGIQLDTTHIASIMTQLGCKVTQDGQLLSITPPTFRSDIAIGADVVEEIARIYGYHHLPSVLPDGMLPAANRSAPDLSQEIVAKRFLAALGGYELYTYSLIDEKKMEIESNWIGQKDSHVKLSNPLTQDLVYLRRTLWSSHVEVLSNSKQVPFVFEFAQVYIPQAAARAQDKKKRQASLSKDSHSDTLPYEEFHLTLTTAGDERTLKGTFENYLATRTIKHVRYRQQSDETQIVAQKTVVGHIVSHEIAEKTYTVIDCDWDALQSVARSYPEYAPPAKYTPIKEDLTFTLPKTVRIGDLMYETQQQFPAVTSVELVSVYKQNSTFTFSYESDAKQLTSDDAALIRSSIVSYISEKYEGKLVGKLEG